MTQFKPIQEIDLHGLRPEEALRRLAQALHTARLQGSRRIRVITGRGLGNPLQEPVLRQKVEAWLMGAQGVRAGARGFTVVSRGGALDVDL